MLDIKRIRDSPDGLRTALKNRGGDPGIVDTVLKLDSEWRELKSSADVLRATKNKVTMEIAKAKKEGKESEAKVHEMHKLNAELDGVERKAGENEGKLTRSC